MGATEKDPGWCGWGDKTGREKQKECSLREYSLGLVLERKAGKGPLTHFTDKDIEAQSSHRAHRSRK